MFDGVARRHELRGRHRKQPAGRYQRSTIDFAVSRQWHALQEDEACRDHVARKLRLEEIAELIDLRLPAGRSDNMRDQPRLAGEVIPQQHDGSLNIRVLRKNVLDLVELNAASPDFHLVVEATKELKCPIAAPTGRIPGPVQARCPRL